VFPLQPLQQYTHDALGNDLSERLSYCESMLWDNDPFSYFANLEGIGLSEEDIIFDEE